MVGFWLWGIEADMIAQCIPRKEPNKKTGVTEWNIKQIKCSSLHMR